VVQCTSGDLSSVSFPGGGVGSVGSIIVSGEADKLTVSGLALKIKPVINTLKVELAALHLTVKELKEGYLLLEQKYDACVVHQAQTDAALKIVNQALVAYDHSKIPRNVGVPLNVLGTPTMVGILNNEVKSGPVLCAPNSVASILPVDLSMLDFDNLFQ